MKKKKTRKSDKTESSGRWLILRIRRTNGSGERFVRDRIIQKRSRHYCGTLTREHLFQLIWYFNLIPRGTAHGVSRCACTNDEYQFAAHQRDIIKGPWQCLRDSRKMLARYEELDLYVARLLSQKKISRNIPAKIFQLKFSYSLQDLRCLINFSGWLDFVPRKKIFVYFFMIIGEWMKNSLS